MSKNTRFEGAVLIVLTLMLVSVFVMSVNMYGGLQENAEYGALAVFSEKVCEFIDENEAVAAFFGFEEHETVEEDVDLVDEAAAYIERYNKLYEDAE